MLQIIVSVYPGYSAIGVTTSVAYAFICVFMASVPLPAMEIREDDTVWMKIIYTCYNLSELSLMQQ